MWHIESKSLFKARDLVSRGAELEYKTTVREVRTYTEPRTMQTT